MESYLVLLFLAALHIGIPSTQADISSKQSRNLSEIGGESLLRLGISNGTGNATADLQNNCNNNCNCNPTVTCAPPVNETEMTSQLLQLVRDQQQQIQTLLSLQENCNSVTKPTRIANLPRDCHDLRRLGETSSRAYDIYPFDDTPVHVFCDMGLAWEGWTVIQRREDGSINFNRSWDDYSNGFGNVNSEHWLGNDNIHHITAQGNYQLRVELEDWDRNVAAATYDKFRVGEAGTRYKLILGQYRGEAGDGLSSLSYQTFTTSDDDQPRVCDGPQHGGWWGSNPAPKDRT
ncbi:fibrinogen-like protein A [Amphiura filiformis]|uniref:fibrinogen-like protein A n=1 Tax=Amphiura filiformis TaxID=82378 RepID=UPI003B21E68E